MGHLWYLSYQPQAMWWWTGLLEPSSRIRSTWGARVDELDCSPRARWKMGSWEEYSEPDPAGSWGCAAAGGSLWNKRHLVVKRWWCNVKDCVSTKQNQKHLAMKGRKKYRPKNTLARVRTHLVTATETGQRIKNDLERKTSLNCWFLINYFLESWIMTIWLTNKVWTHLNSNVAKTFSTNKK